MHLPKNVHFQYQPLGAIGQAMVVSVIINSACDWLSLVMWSPMFWGSLSDPSANDDKIGGAKKWLIYNEIYKSCFNSIMKVDGVVFADSSCLDHLLTEYYSID